MKELLGRVPIAIRGGVHDDVITMTFEDGAIAEWLHKQDCCENVSINDIVGDWADLIGVPLLVAEERVNPLEAPTDDYCGSSTWTFYTFRSNKGSVDVRWFGSSNGYYSERVNFQFKEPPDWNVMAERIAKARLGIRCDEVEDD